jgi:hypothetical protein
LACDREQEIDKNSYCLYTEIPQLLFHWEALDLKTKLKKILKGENVTLRLLA